jgi:hypothetical protein
MPEKPLILVVLAGDGGVEVYGSVKVVFAHRLDCQTVHAERLADEYLDLTLPKNVQPLYTPQNLAGFDVCADHPPEDLIGNMAALEMLRAFRELKTGPRPLPTPGIEMVASDGTPENRD